MPAPAGSARSGNRPGAIKEAVMDGRQVRLQLIRTTAFRSGVTLLCYRPVPGQQGNQAS
jgi:hypothetical protein